MSPQKYPEKCRLPDRILLYAVLYGPDRSRIKQYQSGTGTTIRYAGALFEFEDAATDSYRHYVQAGDKVIALVERVGTTNTRQYLHRDHQGSVTKITDASGNLSQTLAFDAWSLRRDASDWSALGVSPFADAADGWWEGSQRSRGFASAPLRVAQHADVRDAERVMSPRS